MIIFLSKLLAVAFYPLGISLLVSLIGVAAIVLKKHKAA